jgi:hypothetical protein
LSSRLFRVRDVFAVLQPPLFGNVWRAVDPVAKAVTFSPWKLLVDIPRTLAVIFVIARLLTMLEANDAKSAAKLALWLWFGFSGLMWVGAVTWEQNPWQVAAIHSGDWLLKIVLIAVILSASRKDELTRREAGRGAMRDGCGLAMRRLASTSGRLP